MKCRFVIALLLLSLAGISQVRSIDKVTITVSDVDKVKHFYEDAFGAKEIQTNVFKGREMEALFSINDPTCEVKTSLMQIGKEYVELQSFKGKTTKPALIPEDSKSNDLWFQHIAIVVPDMEKAFEVIHRKMAVFVSTSQQTLPNYITAAAGISAFYFRDPDGHNIEIIHFPSGKGNPKWQSDTTSTFEGIDHTAIGIKNTDDAYTFYRDILGMTIGGHSENYGTEQEHLNQVFGARLWITGMKAPEGIGIEFLQYLAPPGGRKYPANSHVYDLWHWHTTARVDNIEDVYKKCVASKFRIISRVLVSIHQRNIGYTKAFLVRDVDGHAVLVTN